MNNRELCHRYATQWGTNPQDMSLSLKGNNLTIEGPAIYSYGTVIARFCRHKGKDYLLVNDTSYSKSTSKHHCHLRRACSHIEPVFRIGDFCFGETLGYVKGIDIYKFYLDRAAESQAKADRARTNKSWRIEQARDAMVMAQVVSDFFGLKKTVDQKAIAKLKTDKEKAEAKYAKELKAAAKRKEEREAEELKEAERDLEDWLHRKGDAGPGFHRLPVRLRTVAYGEGEDVVETSHGAVIPYEEGRRTFRFLARLWRQGKEWRRNGEKFSVGPYHLDSVTGEGIVCGCHRISKETIIAFATKEGWVHDAEETLPPVPPTGEA